MNEWSNVALEKIFLLVGRLGFPLIVTAWLGVFGFCVGMARVINKRLSRAVLVSSLIVGGLSLAAHLLDYFGTLKITPDLAVEANPIWRIVVDRLGLAVARWYGLTGKIMLAILSFEFFAYYISGRPRLLPNAARGFADFWGKYGEKAHFGSRLANFFAFLFALIGPFCFYIALLNALSNSELYMRMPAMPIMLAVYIIILASIYLFGNYLSWRLNNRQNT
jgi:hypothetical protein